MIDKLLEIIDNSEEGLASIAEANSNFYSGISIDGTHALVNAVYSSIANGNKEIDVIYIMSKTNDFKITSEIKAFIKKYLNDKTIFNLINEEGMKIYTYKEIIGE